jgi:long-chain acyl-CoA synthetase
VFPDALHRSAKLYPAKAAVVCGTDRLAYRDVDARANRLANALVGLGLAPGARVALLLDNSTVYWEIYFGIARAGLCCVPVNSHLSAREVDGILADCAASVLIYDDAHAGLAAELGPATDALDLQRIRLAGSEATAELPGRDYRQLLEVASAGSPGDLMPLDGDALIVYTSGTTGRPKGVVLPHRSVVANGLSQVLAHGQRHDDRFITATPLYHLAGAARVQAAAIAGGTHLVMEKFEPDRFLRFAEDESATSALLVATMARKVLEALSEGDYDLSSWRTVCHGAAPTSFDVLARLCELMPVGHFVGWGLTEGGTFLTVLSPDDYRTADGVGERLNSVGRDAINAEVVILGDDGKELSTPGERGRLAVRSDRMMSRYWNQAETTAQVLREGWVLTDDIAYADDDGFLYVVDRRTDMIISGGVNIYPREIEDAFEAHPAVLEAAVIGIPDEVWGEAPLALVVMRRAETVTAAELDAHARELLATFKVPREIVFVDDLPRNSVGKVTKQELRKEHWRGFDKQVN